MTLLTLASLALVFANQEVLEEVANKLQRNILERKRRAMEQLKQMVVVFQMNQRCSFGASECRVASLDDVFEVLGGDFARRNVQREDLVGEVLKAEVLP